MNCYIISYDLIDQKEYEQVYEAIKSYDTWAHITESTWAIVTEQSAIQIRSKLQACTDEDDAIFVIRSGHEAAWQNVNCTNQWLKKNL